MASNGITAALEGGTRKLEQRILFQQGQGSAQSTLAGVATAAEQASCQDEAGDGRCAAADKKRRAARVVPLAALDVCRRLRA